jgi:hypothetical protein
MQIEPICSFQRFVVTASVACLLVSGLVLSGCAQREAPAPAGTFERFVPVSSVPQGVAENTWSGQFALDTVTGQLCYTYVDPTAKRNSIPICKDLLSNK